MATHYHNLHGHKNGHQCGNCAGILNKYNPQGGRVLWRTSSDRVDFAGPSTLLSQKYNPFLGYYCPAFTGEYYHPLLCMYLFSPSNVSIMQFYSF